MLINPNGEEKSFRTMEINEELSCSETYKNFTGLINEDTKSLISHLIKVAFNSLPNEPSVLKNYTNGNISSSDQKEIHNEYFFPTQKILNNLILELMESLGYTKKFHYIVKVWIQEPVK